MSTPSQHYNNDSSICLQSDHKTIINSSFAFIQVETLLCLRCNSLTHGRQCGTDALSLADNSSIVVTCEGTCKVNKVTSPNGKESQYIGYFKTFPYFVYKFSIYIFT